MERFPIHLFRLVCLLLFTNSVECCFPKQTKTAPIKKQTLHEKLSNMNSSQDVEVRMLQIIETRDLSVIKEVFGPDQNGTEIIETLNEHQKLMILNGAITKRDPSILEYLLTTKEYSRLLSESSGRFRSNLIYVFHIQIDNALHLNSTKLFSKLWKNIEIVFKNQPGLINTHSLTSNQDTLLHLIMQQEHFQQHLNLQLELLKMLIQNQANLNAKDRIGYTPLHYAVVESDRNHNSETLMKLVRFLISYGADPNIRSNDGTTFLHISTTRSHSSVELSEIVEYLSSINDTDCFTIADNNGITVLHGAVRSFIVPNKTLQTFKSHGVDFNAVSAEGVFVLFAAIDGGHNEKFLNTLIGFGADWRLRNKNGDSALHHAVVAGNLPAIKLLISLGIDVNAVNDYGRTPLHTVVGWTRTSNQLEIIAELLENGADPNLKEKVFRKSSIDLVRTSRFNDDLKRRALELMQNDLEPI